MKEILCPECGSINSESELSCEKCAALLKLNDKYFLTKILGENIGVTYLAKYADSEPEDLPKKDVLRETVKLQLNKINYNNPETLVIKELSLKTIDKWKNAELFKREGEILSQLNHKSIPKFIEEFEFGIARKAKSYIVMEYIDGQSLREEFKSKRYTEEEAISIILEIAEILEYLHKLRPPIIHRDIKLSNIMRRKSGELVIIDFGSVKNIINSNATISGTYGFMAPEQFTGNASQASDFYALGVILLVLLTRKEPEEMSENGLKLNWKEYIYASENIIYLIEKLLEENPNNRPQSVSDIKKILSTQKNTKSNIQNTTESKPVSKFNTKERFFFEQYKTEFKRIDNKFLGISEDNNYKKWKGNLDTILGFGLLGTMAAVWYKFTWFYGLGAGVIFLIFFMTLTSSWYHSKAKKFLNLFIEKINDGNDFNFTLAMLDIWSEKHDLGDEFKLELEKYKREQASLELIDIQEISKYKKEITSENDFMDFTDYYMKEFYLE